MRVVRWFLLVALLLGFEVYGAAWSRAATELLFAALVSVWAFGKDERPLVHEAHELGVGPRALLQAALCTAVFFVAFLKRVVGHREDLRDNFEFVAALTIAFAVAVPLPAWIETRERAHARRLSRDAKGAVLMLVAGAVSIVIFDAAQAYTEGLALSRTVQRALSEVGVFLKDELADARRPAARALFGLIFVGPALARCHEARPRTVLAIAFLGTILGAGSAYVATDPVLERIDWGALVRYLFHVAPWAYALSLGPALGDKLARRIESRLPKSHSHE